MEQFAHCVYDPHDIVEVRTLPDKRSRWCEASQLLGLAEQLATVNRGGAHVYAGVNPRSCCGNGTRADECAGGQCGKCHRCVPLARCVFVDIDKIDLNGARYRLKESDLPAPTMIVHSGGGVHFYWRLNQPLTDLDLWSRIQRRIIGQLDSDPAIHDPPRIMRLPGFVNHKYDDRPRAYIVEAIPERTYPLAEFEPAGAVTAGSSTSRIGSPECAMPPTSGTTDRGALIEQAQTYASAVPAGLREGQGRNQTAYRVAAALTRDFTLTESEAAPILADWNARNLEPLSDSELQGCLSNGDRYARGVPGSKLPKTRTAAPWRPFPIDALPQPLRRFVSENAAAIGCDPTMIALPALAVVASAIGTSRRIQLKTSWSEPAVLWAAVVAQSGTLKSPALETVLKPVYRCQTEALREHAEAMDDYERELHRFDVELKQWKSKGCKDGSDPPRKPESPPAVRFVCCDATVEALAVLLQDNPRGILLARDELAGWLGSFNAYKRARVGGDAAHWLEMHRAGALLVDRKTGDRKTIHVPRAAVSICGTVQPGTLRRMLGREHVENGLAARLLLVMPPEQLKHWTDATASPKTIDGFAGLLDKLRVLQHNVSADGESEPVDVPLSPDGKTAWIEWYNRFAGRQRETRDPDLRAALAKLEGGAARLALCFHLIRWANVDPDLTDPDAVGPESIEPATAVAEWLADEAQRIYAWLTDVDAGQEQGELLELVRARGGAATVRDLQRGPRQFRGKADRAREVLDSLAKAGLGFWEHPASGEGGGRPSEVLRLYGDAGDGDETPAEATESAVVSPSPLSPGVVDTATAFDAASSSDDEVAE